MTPRFSPRIPSPPNRFLLPLPKGEGRGEGEGTVRESGSPRYFRGVFLLLACICALPSLAQPSTSQCPPVTPPQESFFKLVRERDREVARQFYKKCIDVKGMPVAASAEVSDLALQRTYDLVTHLLAGRPDVLQAMVSNGMYLIVIGKDQVYTDMPEYRSHPNPAYQNERVRGTGGKPTSFGEENVLNLPIDRYDDESIGLHEFCHTIDGTLRSIDPTWSERKNAVFKSVTGKGLWTGAHARTRRTWDRE